MRAFVIAAAWAATVAVAFVVGQFAAPEPVGELRASEPSLPVVEQATTRELAEVMVEDAQRQLGSKPDHIVVPEERAPGAATLSFERRAVRALGDMHPVRRAAAFNALLLELTPQRAAFLYEKLQAQPRTRVVEQELQLLAFAWGEIDGVGAVARFMEEGDDGDRRAWGRRDSLLDGAVAGWAATDPRAAEAWARAQSDDEDNPYMVGVVRGLTMIDPEAASQMLYTLPYGRNRGHAAGHLIDRYLQDGVTAAQAQISALPEDRLKDGLVRMAAGRMAMEDPHATSEWLATLEGVDIENPVSTLGSIWTRKDPDAALAWVSGLEAPEPVRAEGVESIVRHWPEARLADLEPWLTTLESDVVRDEAISELVRRDGYREPEVVEQWLSLMTDPERRERARERANRRSDRNRRGGGVQ